MSFVRHPSWFFEGDNRPVAVSALQDYAGHYTGAWFDGLTDHDLPNRITASDLVAVTTLGVEIPPNKSI